MQTPGGGGGVLMIGPTTTSIAAVTDKQLDVTFGSDDQELEAAAAHLNHYPSYVDGKEQLHESLSIGDSSEGGRGGQLAPIGIKKGLKGSKTAPMGRNEGNYLKNQRSSPVQEETVEEEPEIDSVGDTLQDYENAKKRLAEMEKRYNTITFKQKKQLKKKAMHEKYTHYNFNQTTQDWSKPLHIPKSITAYEEGETQFNFKMP